MSPFDLLREFSDLTVRALAATPDLVCIAAASAAPDAACPACGRRTDRVHSRYNRTVADLPWQDRRVVLRLIARRFRCPTAGCPRAISCERLAPVTAHARTTGRLTDAHRLIGFALGGEAGARLCEHLAAPTSPDTLLRRVKAAPIPPRPTPRVLGVDDFAFRKGRPTAPP